MLELRLAIMDWMKRLDMDPSFADRYLNEGFSGGEKKRNEILQMAILEPELAILDETDSGLDIDALKVVAQGVQEVRADRAGARRRPHHALPAPARLPRTRSRAHPRSTAASSTAAGSSWPSDSSERATRHGGDLMAVNARPRRRPHQEGLPDPRPRDQRQAARLPRLGGDVAEAPLGARRDGATTTRRATPTSTAACTTSPARPPRPTRPRG